MEIKSQTAEAGTQEESVKQQFLIFNLGDASYGINIAYVTEIINVQTITAVPGLPPYIKGIISLRGKIMPVVDARLRFQMEEAEYNERTCIIILEWDGVSVGLIVDGVADVQVFDNLLPPPDQGAGGDQFIEYIGQIHDDMVFIINCAVLLANGDKKDR